MCLNLSSLTKVDWFRMLERILMVSTWKYWWYLHENKVATSWQSLILHIQLFHLRIFDHRILRSNSHSRLAFWPTSWKGLNSVHHTKQQGTPTGHRQQQDELERMATGDIALLFEILCEHSQAIWSWCSSLLCDISDCPPCFVFEDPEKGTSWRLREEMT